jgi:phosphoglycolate phosphatase-like HAD superfamily hydrolase
MGQALGAAVAAVTWGYNDRPALEAHRPDYVIDTPAELLRIA